jgi:glycosyltransferase involved in cell wall biosynthesis
MDDLVMTTPAGAYQEGAEGTLFAAPAPRVALVGTYPPRRCGIATFTRDLAEAIGRGLGVGEGGAAGRSAQPMVIAMTDPGGQYDYPPEVKYEVRQGIRSDYVRAAELVNYSDTSLVSLQHEHGIFGGDDGVYVLDFLAALRVPAVVTLHTVLKRPSDLQRTIVQRMSRLCAGVVVMSQVAADLLVSSYDIAPHNIHVIAHGIPEMEPRDPEDLKKEFGVAGQRMLLTFGLLGPNKGIETVLRALPEAIAAFPELVYFVVGATHPTILRRHGEAYRTTLQQQAEKLGVREHVIFRDQYVSTEELCRYLQATDIFISPYVNEAQVTSGALSYAMGAGAAVISTPYWHAQELLADGRGSLFPFGDSRALSRTLRELLGSPAELHRVRSAAFEFTRSMLWPQVGQRYLELAAAIDARASGPAARRKPKPASALPDLRLDHLLRMTDDTGIIQHATYTVPARHTGYCVDDNARALIVALHADRLSGSAEAKRLVTTYLGFLHHAQTEAGAFRNLMSYDRTFEESSSSEDCTGRAVWALGTAVQLASDDGCRLLARQMLEHTLGETRRLGPRGTALAILGVTSFLAFEPDHQEGKSTLEVLAGKLVERYQQQATDDWRWFEPTLTYDNALIPLALFRAHAVSGDRASLRVARETLEFLEEN